MFSSMFHIYSMLFELNILKNNFQQFKSVDN